MISIAAAHPARALRQPYLFGSLNADIGKFARLCNGERPANPALFANDEAALARILESDDTLGCDIETAGGFTGGPSDWDLRPDKAVPTLIAVASTTEAVSFTWPPPPAFREVLKKRIVGANFFYFDAPILRRFGYDFAPILTDDIRDLRRTLAADSPLSLAYMGSLYCFCPAWKNEGYTRDPRGNAEDALRTAQIYAAMMREAQADMWFSAYGAALYEQQKRISQMAAEMHIQGIGFDIDLAKKLDAELVQTAETRKLHLGELVKEPAFRLGVSGQKPSEADMRALIYEECRRPGFRCFGMPCPPRGSRDAKLARTETGIPSTDQNGLLRLSTSPLCPAELREIIHAYWHVVSPLKLRGVYTQLDREKKRAKKNGGGTEIRQTNLAGAIWDDGRVHPGWNSGARGRRGGRDADTGGTATGRMSCSQPNLQNIPKDRDEDDVMSGALPNMRQLYVAPPGRVLVDWDWESAELWMQAILAGDATLLRMLRAGDVHTETAKAWFRLPPDTTKANCPGRSRRCAKEIRFGARGGAGAEKLWVRTLRRLPDLTLNETKVLLKALNAMHPETKKYQELQVKIAAETGHNFSAIMRRRRTWPAMPEATEAIPQEIQSTVGDLANCAAVGPTFRAIRPMVEGLRDYGGFLVMQTHDSFTAEVAEEHAEAVRDYGIKLMRGPWPIYVRVRDRVEQWEIPVSAKIAKRWSDA